MKRSIRLSPIISLASIVQDGELVAFDVGPERAVYLTFALKPLDYRDNQPGRGSFPKTIPQRAQDYRVIALVGSDVVLDIAISGEQFNISHVQPLGDELLLVCARSCYRGPKDFEKNGRVYTLEGKFVREILLGDGIESVQTTLGGVIWTSYFDEGVFGNFGWENPVGASGLVAWDRHGKMLYDFQPRDGLDPICDCYALNVESEDCAWLYYYTEFPLVRLRDREVSAVWNVPISGSHAFAVSGDKVLFRGGYKDADTYSLFSLGAGNNPKLNAKVSLRDDSGRDIAAERAVGRGDAIHLLSGGFLYRLDVTTAIGG